MFGRSNPRKLKDEATAAAAKGKHQKALDAYLQLERAEPTNGDWGRRAGEMYRSMNRKDEAIAAFTRAVDRYAEAGFLVKAIAVCQMVLRLDASHTQAQSRLVSLNAARGIHLDTPEREVEEPVVAPAAARASVPTPPAPASEAATDSGDRTRTLPPGAALADISLRESVPGAEPVPHLREQGQTSDRVFQIPIEDEDFEELDDIEVEEVKVADEATLAHVPMFSDLPPQALSSLIQKVELIDLDTGEVLFRQGEVGTQLYVVADGEVAVVDEGPPRMRLTTLGEGSFFGEIALVTSQPRSATIEATEPTQVLSIDRSVIGELIEEEPAVLSIMLKFIRDRLLDNLMRSSPLFAAFGDGEREQLARRFRFLELEPGAVLVMQGHRSKGMYVLLAGTAEVVRHDDGGEPMRLATLGPGDLAGEMSLLANADAIATVKTTSKSLALELPGEVFREIIMTHPQVLMYVSEIAEDRKRHFDQVAAGAADYQGTRLDLF